MRSPSRWGATAALTGAVVCVVILTRCNFPTDESTGAYVTVSAPDHVLIRGRQMDVTAQLWMRRGPNDSVAVPNVALMWVSENLDKATLAPSGVRGSIQVTGVNPGFDTLVVSAPAFQRAKPAQYVLRVADALEVDSIRPTTVYYGDQVTIYGVGISNLLLAQLGSVTLLPDTFTTVGDSLGLGQRSFWVPFPADTGHVLVVGNGEFKTAADQINVIPQDLYYPNNTTPTTLDLGQPPPFPTIPTVRFYNPALAFENLPTTGVDWFHFQVPDSTQAYSFVLQAPGLNGTDSVYTGGLVRGGTGQWSNGPGYSDCKGFPFRPAHVPFAGLLVPMSHLHGPSADLVAVHNAAGGYGLTAVEGYLVVDSTVPPDRFESSSDCLFADENFADPVKHIDLTTDFSDLLTIDHPFEVDWLRIHAPGTGVAKVTVSIASRPLAGRTDVSELDLYLLSVPNGSTQLNTVASQTGTGSSKSITAFTAPGDYYVVIADHNGAITPYAICATLSFSCTPPPATGDAAPPGNSGRLHTVPMPRLLSAAAIAGVRAPSRTTRGSLASPRRGP